MKKIISLIGLVTVLAMLAMLALSIGTTGCSTPGGSSTNNVASEVTTIQDIQIGGDAAAAAAILYAGFTGNQTLAAQIVTDQQNFDTLCASGLAAVQSGTNINFAAIEANLATLAKSIEQSFASSPPSNAVSHSVEAVKSARASLASAQRKVATVKLK